MEHIRLDITKKNCQTATEEYIVYGWMPDDKSNTPLVCHQINNRLLKISQQSADRNLPDLDSAVFRAAGNNIVIVWTPRNVEDGCAMTNDQRTVTIHPTSLTIYHRHHYGI